MWAKNFLLEICISIIAIFFVKYLWQRRRFYLLSWKLSGPISIPFLGNGLHFLGPEDEIFEKCVKFCEEYESPIRLWFGPKFTIIFTKVNEAEKIMSSIKFTRKDQVYDFIKPFTGDGLITGSGAKWKKDRRLLTPLFGKLKITSFFPIILDKSKILVEILDKKIDQQSTYFNIQKYFHRQAADLVNEVLLGIKTEAQNGKLNDFLSAISRAYVIVHARMLKIWLQNDWIFQFSSLYREQEKAKMAIYNVLGKGFQERKRLYQTINQTEKCIADNILNIRDKYPDLATDTELIHHINTFYSASEDTISIICSFALVLLGMYSDIQETLYNEIISILGSDKNDFVEENLVGQFKYLDMVVKEILRLFPIAPFVMREAEEDFPLTDEITIPKGCSVAVAIHNIHRDPKHWEYPNDFYPEHFLPEKTAKRHPFAFMPFSAGPRGCIGKGFAYLAIKTTLITVLQNFQVSAEGKLQDLKLKADISVRMKNDCYLVHLKRRNFNIQSI